MRGKMLFVFTVFVLVAVVFFALWYFQPPVEEPGGEDGFKVVEGPAPEPTASPVPTQTPAATPSPEPQPTPTPVDTKAELVKLCRKSIDASLCVSKVATALNNASLCEETILKGQCYYIIATATLDSSLCEKSEDPTKCRAVTEEKPELCEEVASGAGHEAIEEIGLCYNDVAVALGDAALCEKADLVDVCYHSIAIKTGDESLCQKGTDEWECKAVIGEDPLLCEQAYVPEPCYGQLALLLNDTSLADKAGLDTDYYFRIAKDTNNIALCAGARGPKKCEAVLLRDDGLCREASNRKACYGELAIALAEDEAARQE